MESSHESEFDGDDLTSLLHQYEDELAEMKQEVLVLTMQNKQYVGTIKSVTDENKDLHAEIQDLAEEQMKKMSDCVNGTIRNLQSQLKLAHQERDAANKINKETTQLLDNNRLERASAIHDALSKGRMLQETKAQLETLEDAHLQMQMLTESLQEENKTLSQTTSQQIKELQEFHDISRGLKQKLVESVRRNDEDTKTIAGLNTRITELAQRKATVESNCNRIAVEKQQLQAALVEAEGRLAQTLQSLTDSHSQVDKLKMQLVALEKMNNDIEAKEMNYLMQIRESAQLLDDALLARDSAMSKEKQAQDDLGRASVAMDALVQEVADRVKSEVDKAKNHGNAKIRRLADEIELLELENANLRSESDRAKRDKRAAEEELDLLRQHRSDDKDNRQVEEFQRRCIHAERARDDLLITIEKLEEKLKRTERENEEDRSRLLSTNQNLDLRVRRLQRETEESQHERYQLLEAVNRYKTDNQRLEELSRSARLSATKEFSVIKENLSKQKKQLEVKLSCLESSHQTSLRNLHKMLADQQRISARWKDESKHSCEVYEDQMKSLQAQLSRSRKKCHDLMSKLKSVPVQASYEATQLEETNRQLRAELHQSHYKTLSLAKQLTDTQSRSNDIGLRDLQ